MNYSRDLKRILAFSKETALLTKRPYVCRDVLFESLLSINNISIVSILNEIGLDINNLFMISKIFLSKKKNSVRPSGSFSAEVKELLAEMEAIAEAYEEPDCRPEILLQAFINSDKKPKVYL